MAVGIHTDNPVENYYAWNPNSLRHLSVGAVILNEHNQVLVHKLDRIGGKYFMPKKTHRPDQTLEQTLSRIESETGWKVEIIDYIGSQISTFPIPGEKTVDKTTLWFLCGPVDRSQRDIEDRDADSELQWVELDQMVDIFSEQGQNTVDNDLDQSEILSKVQVMIRKRSSVLKVE